jgi:hypothetical protein
VNDKLWPEPIPRTERDELRLPTTVPLAARDGSPGKVASPSGSAYLDRVLPVRRLAFLSLVWVACAPSPEVGQLKIRAAHEMSCGDRDDIHVKALGNDVYDVEGCGKHARYAWICDGHAPMSPCKWVRHAEAKPTGSSPGT